MVERTLGRYLRLGMWEEEKSDFGKLRQKTDYKERDLYLELSHLLQLELEFCHTPPHVKQAQVDSRGAGGQGLAERPCGLQGAKSLPTRDMGSSYEKRAAKNLRKPERKV